MDKHEIQSQLDAFRTKLDELKVQGSLLKMEYRDKHPETVSRMENAFAAARDKFDALKTASAEEAAKIGAGFDAAWASFKSAWQDTVEGDS